MSRTRGNCLAKTGQRLGAFFGLLGACLFLGAPAAAQTLYANDFEGTVGPEWSATATDVTPSGRRFLGQFGNETVRLNLQELPAHSQLTVSFDLFIIRSWDGSGENGYGPDLWTLGVEGGPTLLQSTFSYTGCRFNRQSYPAAYGQGLFAGGTGAAEMNTLGYTHRFTGGVFPVDGVYQLSFTFPHTGAALALNFGASGLQELLDESWGLDNLRVEIPTEPAGRLSVSTSRLEFGSLPKRGVVRKSFRIRNTGHGPLTGCVSTILKPFRVLSGGGKFTLARGKSRRVTVEFAPRGRSRFREWLVVSSDDPQRSRASVATHGTAR